MQNFTGWVHMTALAGMISTQSLAADVSSATNIVETTGTEPAVTEAPAPTVPDGIWDLTDLYPDVASWENARADLEARLNELDICKGKLDDSADILAACLNTTSDIYRDLLRLYVYTFLAKDTDLGNSEYRERSSLAQSLYTRFSENVSFLEPELVEIGEKKLNRWLRRTKALQDHDFYIRNTLRNSQHILSQEEERILAAAGDALSTASNVYEILTNAEIPWPTVTLSDESEVLLNSQGYAKHRAADNRADRKLVFDTFWNAFQGYRQTLAVTLEGQIKSQVLTAKLRGYDSALQQSLATDNIPEAVYRALVDTVNNHLHSLHRFIGLRQRIMKLDDFHYYDIYPSAVSLNREYDIAETIRITTTSLEPLGEEYVEKFSNAVSQDWMHIYPAEGKRSGAYVMGAAYDVHPYMLLNHTNDIESVSTFTHEWGHAMHSLLANESQPFTKADYATFTAEIASTANEVLLFDYLRANAENDQEQLYFLFKELSQIRGTFFRQTQFAEFELAIHEEVENGGALSGDKLNLMYGDILKRYFGHDQGVMKVDDTYTAEWAYIPHFYRNFYVYQYATSISAAYFLMDKVLNEGSEAQQQYLDILRAGGSDYPYDILRRAGVDMASPKVYEAVIRRMNRLMDEAEAILDRQG